MNFFPCTLLDLLASCTRMNQFYIKLNYYLGGNRSPFSSSFSHVPKLIEFVLCSCTWILEKKHVFHIILSIHPLVASQTLVHEVVQGSTSTHTHTVAEELLEYFFVFQISARKKQGNASSPWRLFRLELRHGVA